MSRPVRLSLAALALMLGGCYSGFDADTAATLPGTTGEPASSSSAGESGPEATTAPMSSTTTSSGGEGGTTTGAPETSDGGDTTEGASSASTSTSGIGDTTTMGAETTMADTTGEPPPPPPPNPDVPDGVPYCDPAKPWDPAWKKLEEDVLAIVNEKRAQGADCHSEGMFGPAGPLAMNPALRCAARMHSKDMVDRNFFSHTNPDGELPWDRMKKAGYGPYTNAGENIAAGSATAAGTMDQWMNSDGHCANIMNPDFKEIGVGYYPGGKYGHVWTQVFGAK